MVTVKIGDGMGNQMYNYACGYAVSRRLGQKLRLDISECSGRGSDDPPQFHTAGF